MIEQRERIPIRRRLKPTDINGWILLGGLAAFVVAVYLFTRNGCDNEFAELLRLRMVKVDTWAEWQEHLAGTDLYLKYRAYNVSYEPDSIRSDFVKNVSLSILSDSPARRGESGEAGGVPSQANPIVWNEGTSLHIGSPTTDAEFELWKAFSEQLVKRDWTAMSGEEYYIYATIASLFQEVVVHGPDDKTARITLPFLFSQ